MNPPNPSDALRDNTLSSALEGLWQRFLPAMIERLAVLESAATAMGSREIAPEQREAAQAAAHKLAGVLGTFGLARGTEIARELERALALKTPLDAEAAAQFAASVAELGQVIQSRKA